MTQDPTTGGSAGARPRPSPYPRPDAPAPVAAEPPALVAAETEVADKAAVAERKEAAEKAKAEKEKADKEKAARTPDQIRADIAATREELAQTVDALAAKLDVKTRARAGLDQAKVYVTDPEHRPQVIAAVVGVLALVALRVTRSRRKS